MQKVIRSDVLRSALAKHGMTQTRLANTLGVSPQAVTNWLNNQDFPRPATLLRLASTLGLTFDEMVETERFGRPVVAFRKKGNAKTTLDHISKAEGIGMLLKPLVPFLPEQRALRTLITSPSLDYQKLQIAVAQTRTRLGIGEQAVLEYEHLIGEFKDCGAVLVPVMWGAKQRHENALHIRLPEEDVTFIFLNLDTRLEDFKFWLAHELAHVYTPELAGTNDGEDYADAFAGALLFPKACAETAYHDTLQIAGDEALMIDCLRRYADAYMISLNTVYQQVKAFIGAAGLPGLAIREKNIHVARTNYAGPLISEALFDPMPPAPDRYIADCENVFQSDFFHALKRMLREQNTGPSYLQQVLDASIHDARAMYEELRH